MSTPADDSLGALLGLLALAVSLALYVWTALALSAMFRKMGEDAWKGWVPLVNVATLLAWGGFSPWLILLAFVPIFGAFAVLVLLIISAHRINSGFGYGGGMTALAALLLVVWASILGFGPARWLGARRRARVAPPSLAPPTASSPADLRPAPVAPAAPITVSHSADALPAPADVAPDPAPAEPAGGWQPWGEIPQDAAPASSRALESDASFAPPAAPAADRWAPPAAPAAPTSDPADAPEAAIASIPAPVRGAGAVDDADELDDVEEGDADEGDAAWPSEIDDVSAISPSPFPPSAAGGRPFVAPPVGRVGEGGEVSDDPNPIAFVPGRRAGSESSLPSAPVTRVPAVRPTDAAPPASPPARMSDPNSAIFAQPSRPRQSADPDPDGFLELSGEVSAVVGAPAAGRPRSATGAVSAQHRRFDDPDDDEGVDELTRATRGAVSLDDIDQTVIARRSVRPTWELVPAAGSPVPLTAPVVILGRRPAADPAFPGAQLLAVAGDARTVSKTHARIEQRGESWIVTDLGSTNGVLVRTLMGDEVEVEPGAQLDAGERFFLGDEEFHLRRITR